MAVSSNFSEAAYKRSKAIDKERKYKEQTLIQWTIKFNESAYCIEIAKIH